MLSVLRNVRIRHVVSFLVRAVALLAMSFAGAFGFMAAARSPNANYDPYMFAIGAAALFGAACGGMGLMISSNRTLRTRLRALRDRIEELSDHNWELKEADERARSFLEAQGDVIVRRDGDGRITYANDGFCALAGKPREALLGQAFRLATLQ